MKLTTYVIKYIDMINEQELRNRITKNIIYYRKKAGMTQMEVANLLSYSDKAISKWERGLGLPDITVLAQLADLYGVTISELCEADHDGEKPIKEVDDETQKIIEKRHQLITYISVGLLWLMSTILFFIFKMIFDNPHLKFYLIFIYSIPATFIDLLVFNLLWGKAKLNGVYESLISWTIAASLILTIYPALDNPNIFYVLLVALTFQALVILWNILLNTGRIFKNRFVRRNRRRQRKQDRRKRRGK